MSGGLCRCKACQEVWGLAPLPHSQMVSDMAGYWDSDHDYSPEGIEVLQDALGGGMTNRKDRYGSLIEQMQAVRLAFHDMSVYVEINKDMLSYEQMCADLTIMARHGVEYVDGKSNYIQPVKWMRLSREDN